MSGRSILIQLCLVVCLGVICASPVRADCRVPAGLNEMASVIATGMNAGRASQGLPALGFSQELSAAAMAHACDMQANGFFGHHGSDGSNSQVRARQANYQACTIAENLAWGYPDPGQIISGWLSSSKHRDNIMLTRVREFGIGIAEGSDGPLWVLVLARGC